MFRNTLRTLLFWSLFVGLAICRNSVSAAVSTPLAAGGQATQPVVTAAVATPKVKELASTLAEYLSRISGAKLEVKEGDGKSGLAVGTARDFPALDLAKEFDPTNPTRHEEYLLRSHAKGVLLIGATELAVSHAVWDFLYRLGYRQFFPGKHWEVVPSTPNLSIAVDVKEKPDFYGRRIWYGFGDWPDNGADKVNWDARNRVASGLSINNGHAWDGIYKDRKAEFDAHPEYLMSQHPVKFCVSNPGLRKLVVDWALEYFDKHPEADSVSLEPSDGDGWDNPESACRDSEVYKSVTDRVVSLANEVAQAVNKKYPGKYVGIYAYFKHSPPPTIKVDPHVAVGVATAFSAGFDNIAPGWSKQGATIGVREYYSVVVGHKDKPGGIGDPRGIAAAIKRQYGFGARFMSAESSDSWGPGGLGYYLAARVLWDTKTDPEAILNDFFEKAFGPAQKPMREFYAMIDRANKPLFSSDLIGRMYRKIDEARKLTDDDGVRGRLDDLALYTRYVELLKGIHDETSEGAALSHAYRIRSTHMVHSYALWRDTRGWPYRPTGDTIWNVPEGKNPWKSSAPFSAEEIAKIISDGIANNPLMSFTPVAFSKELVPASPLGLKTPGTVGQNGYCRPSHHFYLWVDKAPATVKLTVTGGQIGPSGKTTVELYAVDDPTSQLLSSAQVPNDRQPYDIELKTSFAGLHRVEVETQRAGAAMSWPDGTRVVFASSIEEPITLGHRVDMYFYVPRGTKVVGGFAQGVGALRDGDNNPKPIFTFSKEEFGKGNYFSVPVPPGQDGKLWEFVSSNGPRLLMTVPPYLARNADELLLPKEVVAADAPKE
jgi:hypothetical protein